MRISPVTREFCKEAHCCRRSEIHPNCVEIFLPVNLLFKLSKRFETLHLYKNFVRIFPKPPFVDYYENWSTRSLAVKSIIYI